MVKGYVYHNLIRDRWLYMMLGVPLIHILIFQYIPMYGQLIVFQDYDLYSGFFHSKWIGFENIVKVVNDPFFWRVFLNTVRLGLVTFIFCFPAPILFALLLNEVKREKYKKFVQTVTYMPNFVSMVVICGIIIGMLAPSTGFINLLIKTITGQTIYFMIESEWFIPIYVISDIWIGVGFGAIIYLAALSGIDPTLYESADMDGANRFQKAIWITIPSIKSTILMLLILGMPGIISVNFEKVLLLYHPLTYEVADVIPTYVYRKGLLGGEFSYGATVGLFLSVISFGIIVMTNKLVKKYAGTSLW